MLCGAGILSDLETNVVRRAGSWLTGALVLGMVVASTLLVGAPLVLAGSATYSGTLTNASPTYHRLNPNGCSVLSLVVGLNVFYQAQTFTVDLTGTYTLTN